MKKIISKLLIIAIVISFVIPEIKSEAASVKLEQPRIGLKKTQTTNSLYATINFTGNVMLKSSKAYRKHQTKQSNYYIFKNCNRSMMADGYKIQRKKNNGEFKTLQTVKVKKRGNQYRLKLLFKDNKIQYGTTYTYRVVLYKKIGSKTKTVKSLTRQLTIKKKKEEPVQEPEDVETEESDNNKVETLTKDQMNHYNDNFEQKMLNVINEYRKREGLNPMVLEPRLCQVARERLLEEIEEDKIGDPTGVHIRPNGKEHYDIYTPLGIKDITPMGENWVLGYDFIGDYCAFNDFITSVSWFDWYNPTYYLAYAGGWDIALMILIQSPGHYANMLEKENTCFGAAFVKQGRYVYWMQEFGYYGKNYFYGREDNY